MADGSAVPVLLYIAMPGDPVHRTIELEPWDISRGGVCFETSRDVPVETLSRLVISRVGDLPGPILIHGRVAWRRQNPFDGRYLVGLEFTGFENVTREELLSRIEAGRSGS